LDFCCGKRRFGLPGAVIGAKAIWKTGRKFASPFAAFVIALCLSPSLDLAVSRNKAQKWCISLIPLVQMWATGVDLVLK